MMALCRDVVPPLDLKLLAARAQLWTWLEPAREQH